MKLSIEGNRECCLGQYSILPPRCINDRQSIFDYTVGYLSTNYSDKIFKSYRHDHILIKKNKNHYIVKCINKNSWWQRGRIINSSKSLRFNKHSDS